MRSCLVAPVLHLRIRRATFGLAGLVDEERLLALRPDQPIDIADLYAVDAAKELSSGYDHALVRPTVEILDALVQENGLDRGPGNRSVESVDIARI